ncbi:protein moonraker isoform X1 [Synchiropus splendidus]|uniref:protein moonraker isoform X1 n=1 Tax=Synchiropus splendidus TaxID=270530 RepID=UPI00237DB7C4|nr:protein moonraker isoform X1 [Synchiropus splendidus]
MISQTKLLFNEDILARTSNRATRVASPSVIVIEKLLPNSRERQHNVDSNQSSFGFTVLSEESVNNAVLLAKRDLRNMRLHSNDQQDSVLVTNGVTVYQDLEVDQEKSKAKSSEVKPIRPISKPLPKPSKKSSQRAPTSAVLPAGPKARNPALKPLGDNQKSVLGQEICRLQNELELYVRKVEDLANKEEKEEEPLDPDEEKKIQIRREKQAARSSRFIYDLQHQVKEIQDDIVKLRSQNLWDSNKSTAVHRLAAAHRGTLRALQLVVQQIEDLSRGVLPPHHRELGQLIRQLSLCSAKIEVDHGSVVPEATLDILQKLETLDSAWNKQTLHNTHVSASPPRRRSPHHSMSPQRAPRGASKTRGRSKPTNLKRNNHGKRKRLQKPQVTFSQPLTRGDVLRGCLQLLAQQRGLVLHTNTPHAEATAPQPLWRKPKPTMTDNPKPDVSFHQPTVASRLRVNQIPQKEQSVPWMPTSPHTPYPARSPERSRPAPRCLFSTEKPPQSPPKQAAACIGKEPAVKASSQRKIYQEEEAVRRGRLETATTRQLKEDGEHIQRFRPDNVSPTQRAEQVRQRMQPLLDEVQQIRKAGNAATSPLRSLLSETAAETAAESPEQLSEAILEDLSQGTTQNCLETMLLRMEAIQVRGTPQTSSSEKGLCCTRKRDQEEVRRRFASITYSDPQHWSQTGGAGRFGSGTQPVSPLPIRLTRPVLRLNPEADILLEKPVDTGASVLSETSVTEDAPPDAPPSGTSKFPGPVARRTAATVLSVPGSMLGRIRRYREAYSSHLFGSREDVIGLNPWAIADSLAEELLSEVMADVAAEFQDVAEEYTEAIFTSEFLKPVPAASAAAMMA